MVHDAAVDDDASGHAGAWTVDWRRDGRLRHGQIMIQNQSDPFPTLIFKNAKHQYKES